MSDAPLFSGKFVYEKVVLQNPAKNPNPDDLRPELIYETGTQTFYLLKQAESNRLRSSSRALMENITRLDQAVSLPNNTLEEKKKRTTSVRYVRKAVSNGLSQIVTGPGKNILAEVISFKQKRFFYLKLADVQAFQNKYAVKEPAAQQAVQDQGKFSTSKLLCHIQRSTPLDLGAWSKDYDGSMKQLASALGIPSLDISGAFFQDPNNPNSHFVASADARLMRYTAGVSESADYNPGTRNFSFSADGHYEVILADGHINTRCFIPNREGLNIAFELPTPKGPRLFELGHFRVEFILGLYGFTGASVMASMNMECCMSPEGKLEVKGSANDSVASQLPYVPPPKPDWAKNMPEPPQSEMQKKASDPHYVTPQRAAGGGGASIFGDAFAGVKAGCNVGCAFSWQNPEASGNWQDMASLDADGDVSAGVGINGDFRIDYNYDTGKFLVHASAGITCGPGVDGGITFPLA